MEHLYNYSLEELTEYFKSINEKPFRAKQVFQWLYQKNAFDFQEMSNISKDLREKLEKQCIIDTFEIQEKQVSSDGTIKYLFKMIDGNLIEAVLMRHDYGQSLCVTSQVGCNMQCAFCASGLLKKQRNLTAGEMVNQVMAVAKDTGIRVSHVVVMGTGEPFDNYDEVIDSVEEVRQSLLMALVDRKINQYIAKVDGIVKKLENDKYFIIIRKSYFKQLEEDKFSLLDDVKSVNIGNGIPATLSIGLGLSSDSYAQSYNYARVAIDLALARGGDQAVIKDCNGVTYYGGKREQTAKNTRVKARVKAEALREFITVKDKIFVMGHKLTDVDAFGAAMGIYRAALALEKRAYIVINEVSASLRPLYELFEQDSAYPDDLFLTSSQAMNMADENSMVVVVDTNRPMMTECEDLLKTTKTIVVLDHHRQSSDNIDNALLSYIEPYASSACEMVSEVLQYIVDGIKIPKIEASSLYAGIMIDTNNFVNSTGVRTFEAAAFLRRSGADITLVRKLFRDDMESYRAKAEIISSAEVYRNKFAIARGVDLHIESPTIIGAQAANELLDISAIKASFVLTEYNGRIYVSARSIDEVNVQIIMERLGGGGHMNASGAQFNHTDMDEAVACLKQVIDEMIEGGDL